MEGFSIDPGPKGEPIGPVNPPKGIAKSTYEKVVNVARICHLMGDDSLESIARASGVSRSRVGKILASDEFDKSMRLSGIIWSKKAILTPEQAYVIQLLTDPTKSKMSLDRKLAAAGITYTKYRNWMKQPAFSKAIESISEQMLGDNITNIHSAVVGRAVNGDLMAAKMVYELTGRYDPARNQIGDIQKVIQQLLSVITMHVRDTNVLAAIAADMDGVLNGRAPSVAALPANYNGPPVVTEDAILVED